MMLTYVRPVVALDVLTCCFGAIGQDLSDLPSCAVRAHPRPFLNLTNGAVASTGPSEHQLDRLPDHGYRLHLQGSKFH